MKIYAESKEENKKLEAVSNFIKTLGLSADSKRYEDSFALTVWSIDDITSKNISDKYIDDMSDNDKEDFLRFAVQQLRSDMVERGWNSLECLYGEFKTLRMQEKYND